MANEKFELRGINHLALVCKDMKRTVEFYEGVLGMPLTKTINLPNDSGQHFFFDAGNGDSLAFFWFPDAPESQPGVTHPANRIGEGSLTTAHASMNHVAFDVAPEQIGEYQRKLEALTTQRGQYIPGAKVTVNETRCVYPADKGSQLIQ